MSGPDAAGEQARLPDRPAHPLPAFPLFDTWVNALTLQDFLEVLEESARGDKKFLIANHNLHSLYLHARDPGMRAFCERASFTVVDGMAVVALARLVGHPLRRDHRLACLDWLDPVMRKAAEQGWRVMYIGGAPGVAERAAGVLRERVPGLLLRVEHGYFDASAGSRENAERIEAIKAYRPHLLLVGMGMPRQERWILENLGELSANSILNVGALFDYLGGAQPLPPRWIGQVGLEWLYRLAHDPKRLWRRYLLEPLFLARKLPRELIGRRLGWARPA